MQCQTRLAVLILLMLPVGGILGIHLVLLAYTLYEPSLWSAIWSDLSWSALSPAAHDAIKHSGVIGITTGVWMGWEIWNAGSRRIKRLTIVPVSNC